MDLNQFGWLTCPFVTRWLPRGAMDLNESGMSDYEFQTVGSLVEPWIYIIAIRGKTPAGEKLAPSWSHGSKFVLDVGF